MKFSRPFDLLLFLFFPFFFIFYLELMNETVPLTTFEMSLLVSTSASAILVWNKRQIELLFKKKCVLPRRVGRDPTLAWQYRYAFNIQ